MTHSRNRSGIVPESRTSRAGRILTGREEEGKRKGMEGKERGDFPSIRHLSDASHRDGWMAR